MYIAQQLQVKEENKNRPATKKQLWALFTITKHDYRNENLTMQQASDLITSLKQSGKKAAPKSAPKSVDKLETLFIEHMTDKIKGVIAVARDALKIKSVITDDPAFFPNRKNRQSFALFGFGCGITIIDFDKRSKKGKRIIELSQKHHMGKFLNMFLEGFTPKEIKQFEKVGCPLSALYYQDIRISAAYEHAVVEFMNKQGVKNVRMRTYDD